MGIEEDDIPPEQFLEDIEMRVGEITSVEPFPEADKDIYRRSRPRVKAVS